MWAEKVGKMRTINLLAALLLLSLTVFAQADPQTISGKVSDASGPVSGAEVTLTSSRDASFSRTAVTDASGLYTFQNILQGKYQIKVSYPGQTDVVQAVSHVLGRETTANITFGTPNAISETVTISADTEQTLDEVAKTVNVITGREMRDRGDYTLADSLRTIPGFRIQQLGGFGRFASVKARGLRNQDTALLIDGVRFRDAAAINGDASSFLGDFTLSSVSRVEVLRGTGSSLYGTNAVGGTVNFITPTARKGWHGQLSGNIGELGFGRFRGVTSYGSDDGKYGLNIGFSRTAFTKGIDGEDNANNTSFQPRFDLKPTNRTNISARFYFSDAFVRLNSSPDTLGTLPPDNTTIINAVEGVNFVADVNDPDNFQKARFFSGVFSVSQSLTNDLTLNGYYSGLASRRRDEAGPLGVGWQSESTTFNRGAIHTANAGLLWTPKYHTVRIGYEFEHERYENEGLTPGGFEDFLARAFQSSHSFFAQDLIGLLGGRLQLSGGFRVQWFDLKRPEFSDVNAPYTSFTLNSPPSASTLDGAVSYLFETGTKLRFHIGTGYRVPSLYERFGSYYSTWPLPGFVALGDPELEPERSLVFDAGVEQSLFEGRARLSATYFYSHLRDIIGYGNFDSPDEHGRWSGYLNTEGGKARGGEFSADIRPTSSTDIFASYTYTDSKQREPQVAGSGVFRSLAIPEHQFTLTATQRYKQFWVNADVLLASDYLGAIFSNATFSSYLYRFDGNRRVDLTAGYTFNFAERYSLRLYGTVENLFDNEYFENGFRTPGRNSRIGLNFSF